MMQNSHAELLDRLNAFSLDDADAGFSFSQKLARENRWTLSLAKRVVKEYKRFLFLAMVADHPVTPSDEVDQAWQLHLTYTGSYWNLLCREVLHRPLLGGIVFSFMWRPQRSRFGDKVLARLIKTYFKYKTNGWKELGKPEADQSWLPISVPLFGLSSLEGTPYSHLNRKLGQPESSHGACGSSSSDGVGSGCGGGTGGCGGCGGCGD